MFKKITDFLRDQIWQSIGAIIAIIGIFVAYNIFFLQKQEKSLDVVLLTNVSVINISPEVADKIQVYYQDEIAKDVFLLEFQLQNTGNRAVTSSDYESPIIFSVNPNFEIVESYVSQTNPKNIDFAITKLNSHEIQAPSVLLNPGDTITIRVILINRKSTNENINFQVAGRIVDIKQIGVISESQTTAIEVNIFGIKIPIRSDENIWLLVITLVITITTFASAFKEIVDFIGSSKSKETK